MSSYPEFKTIEEATKSARISAIKTGNRKFILARKAPDMKSMVYAYSTRIDEPLKANWAIIAYVDVR